MIIQICSSLLRLGILQLYQQRSPAQLAGQSNLSNVDCGRTDSIGTDSHNETVDSIRPFPVSSRLNRESVEAKFEVCSLKANCFSIQIWNIWMYFISGNCSSFFRDPAICHLYSIIFSNTFFVIYNVLCSQLYFSMLSTRPILAQSILRVGWPASKAYAWANADVRKLCHGQPWDRTIVGSCTTKSTRSEEYLPRLWISNRKPIARTRTSIVQS